jgi:hypothetical protein
MSGSPLLHSPLELCQPGPKSVEKLFHQTNSCHCSIEAVSDKKVLSIRRVNPGDTEIQARPARDISELKFQCSIDDVNWIAGN